MKHAIGPIEREFYKGVGCKIAARRQQCGMSQQALALKVGLPRDAISRYETNVLPISLWMLLRVADILTYDHRSLLPARSYIWGDSLCPLRESKPLTPVRYERDPPLSAKERKL